MTHYDIESQRRREVAKAIKNIDIPYKPYFDGPTATELEMIDPSERYRMILSMKAFEPREQ
ncbi:hypothetical protein KW805_00180 [Candidatus Pacearchaeota archaeon]|nr:hypothetical protein [Candidatus Pacearchaeota archaeon]